MFNEGAKQREQRAREKTIKNNIDLYQNVPMCQCAGMCETLENKIKIQKTYTTQ